MSMKSEILDVLTYADEPLTSEDIIVNVHANGTEWKRSSIRKVLGDLVTNGKVRNLDRNPETGTYSRTPCRFELA